MSALRIIPAFEKWFLLEFRHFHAGGSLALGWGLEAKSIPPCTSMLSQQLEVGWGSLEQTGSQVRRNQQAGNWGRRTVGKGLALRAQGPKFNPQNPRTKKPCLAVCVCDPITRQTGTRGCLRLNARQPDLLASTGERLWRKTVISAWGTIVEVVLWPTHTPHTHT